MAWTSSGGDSLAVTPGQDGGKWPLPAAVSALSALIVLLPVIVRPGWPAHHDPLHAFHRGLAMYGRLAAGDFLPLWSTADGWDYGAPIFAVYHRLSSHVDALFLALTGDGRVAMVLTLATAMTWGGVGAIRLAALLAGDRKLSLMAAPMFLSANYLSADWVERGAMAEVFAMCVLPWIFRDLLACASQGRVPRSFGLHWGLLFLSHMTLSYVLALIIAALFPPFLLLLALSGRLPLRRLPAIAGRILVHAFLCALALAPVLVGLLAFSAYWVPETFAVHSDTSNAEEIRRSTAFFDPRRNLHWWKGDDEPVPKAWFVTDWVNAGPHEFSRRLDLIPLASVPVALVLVLVARLRGRRVDAPAYRWPGWGFLVVVTGVSLLLQTSPGLWFFNHVPYTPYLQFAWRVLVIPGTLLPAIALAAMAQIPGRSGISRTAHAAARLIVIASLVVHLLQPPLSGYWLPGEDVWLPGKDVANSGATPVRALSKDSLGSVVVDRDGQPVRSYVRYIGELDNYLRQQAGNCRVGPMPPTGERLRTVLTLECPAPGVQTVFLPWTGYETVLVRDTGTGQLFRVRNFRRCRDARLHLEIPAAGHYELTVIHPRLSTVFRTMLARGMRPVDPLAGCLPGEAASS